MARSVYWTIILSWGTCSGLQTLVWKLAWRRMSCMGWSAGKRVCEETRLCRQTARLNRVPSWLCLGFFIDTVGVVRVPTSSGCVTWVSPHCHCYRSLTWGRWGGRRSSQQQCPGSEFLTILGGWFSERVFALGQEGRLLLSPFSPALREGHLL